jgi:signal transduction histidine kinase
LKHESNSRGRWVTIVLAVIFSTRQAAGNELPSNVGRFSKPFRIEERIGNPSYGRLIPATCLISVRKLHTMSEPPSSSQTLSSDGWIIPDAARMESLAEFAAGAGHEINNPLATIIGRAQQLLKDEQNPQRRQMLQAIGAQAYRIRDMIGDAMLFGRPPQPELQDIVLANLVEQVVTRLGDVLSTSNCCVTSSVPPDMTLRADPVQCAIVISELIRNSCQALLPTGGEILLRATRCDQEMAQIEIEDHGCGFAEQERIHAFDPFFSGRQAGRGLGFGLPKCWQIVRQHHGRMEIHSLPHTSDNSGTTTVRIYWPLVRSS